MVHAVTLSGTSDRSERFGFLRGNTSTSDADVGAISYSDGVILSGGSQVLPAGLNSFTISVATVDDSEVESDEVYGLSVAGIPATGTDPGQ